MIELGANRYGKSQIRLVKVTRGAERHVLRDLTVSIALEGDFADAHVTGDQANVIATDTMKNTVYALAKDGLTGSIEAFGALLGRHFLESEQVARATVTLREHGWTPIETRRGPAPDAFMRSGGMTRLAVVTAARDGVAYEAGIEDLVVMKTTKSAFAGFVRDRFTTLADVDDRIMATKVTATWGYGPDAAHADPGEGEGFDAVFVAVRSTLLDVFTTHVSPAVQTSIWLMGRAILEAQPSVEWIRMVLPNLHHWLVDLTPFGMTNDREIYVATTEPHGLIDATVRRSDAAPGSSAQPGS